MGISHSTARWLAPASFAYDFALQQYGLLSSPNMKDIHDANLSFFSPQPYFIGAFFFPQQIFQLVWLYKLWQGQGTQEEVAEMVDYAPIYALGNFCIGTWMFFWNSNDLATSNVFVIINTVSQIAYLTTRLKPMRTNSTPSMLTHFVAKTFAGIGVLDLLHNTTAAFYKGVRAPNTLVKALTGVGFAAAGASSDWIFGGCLVYDLVALAVGQSSRDSSWSGLLGAYAVGTAAIVGARNYLKPPYQSGKTEYQQVQEDVEDRV
ncbi:hypothetical protein K490DRAFT_62489 [Saccharata proteae CBS 121410]|uniref:Concanavalin a-like lectins glucanase protein n=1 Tax=Saccharata proteae CBS 121410 TaxID=1314787 RepID=A0A9P4M1F1_9PEZI|nr:hypothetical protein K490DRAFT_62489 [Saccharata proteae CBS 121410]